MGVEFRVVEECVVTGDSTADGDGRKCGMEVVIKWW